MVVFPAAVSLEVTSDVDLGVPGRFSLGVPVKVDFGVNDGSMFTVFCPNLLSSKLYI